MHAKEGSPGTGAEPVGRLTHAGDPEASQNSLLCAEPRSASSPSSHHLLGEVAQLPAVVPRGHPRAPQMPQACEAPRRAGGGPPREGVVVSFWEG